MSQIQAVNVPEQAAGYDARDYRDDFSSMWPEQRKDGFLYRREVRKVLSVDTRVWPTVFASLRESAPAHQESLQDLWADEDDLRKALSDSGTRQVLPPFRTVVVTLVWDGAENRHPLTSQLAGFVEAPKKASDWQFMGFDVASTWLLSVLSNCGFLPGHDDIDGLRREWGPHLNDFHLFSELSAASAFRRMADEKLAGEHGPTFVYGLHVLGLNP